MRHPRTDDYGPAAWVETDAGGPIIDASPLVARHIFGTAGAGWSDHVRIKVTKVAKDTPLGPCKADDGDGSGGVSAGGGKKSPSSCHSDTLGRDVPSNTCVQSAADKQYYQCDDGKWVSQWQDPSACSARYYLSDDGRAASSWGGTRAEQRRRAVPTRRDTLGRCRRAAGVAPSRACTLRDG